MAHRRKDYFLSSKCFKRNYETAVLGMKTLADGYLYKNPKQAIRYTLSLPIASLVIGINRMDHLEQDLEIINNFLRLQAMNMNRSKVMLPN